MRFNTHPLVHYHSTDTQSAAIYRPVHAIQIPVIPRSCNCYYDWLLVFRKLALDTSQTCIMQSMLVAVDQWRKCRACVQLKQETVLSCSGPMHPSCGTVMSLVPHEERSNSTNDQQGKVHAWEKAVNRGMHRRMDASVMYSQTSLNPHTSVFHTNIRIGEGTG